MRVVLDTNVLVSALHFPGGAPELVYRLALERRINLVTSRALLTELARVLTQKFGWDDARTEMAIRQILGLAVLAEPTATVRVVTADPTDDRVLEAAAAGEAVVIVSGDRHLLQLTSWREIRILRPAELLTEFA